MLQDVVHSSKQLHPIEEISSPFGSQMFDYGDHQTFCCYEENISPYPFPQEIDQLTNVVDHNVTTTIDLSPSISQLIDPPPPPPPPLLMASVDDHHHQQYLHIDDYDDECLSSSVPSSSYYYVPLNPPPEAAAASCSSFLDDQTLMGNLSFGIFMGGDEFQPQQLGLQGDNAGIFCSDPLQPIFNSGELQGPRNEWQQVVSGNCNPSMGSEMLKLGEVCTTFKVGKLSVEERKEKIHRYLKKRNERNFTKKIKYACRKTLADSRPRVRGRFAKNDEFGDHHTTTTTTNSINHEEDTDFDDLIPSSNLHVMVKEEDEIATSDIFGHISGVNSFKCNYPILQSWI